MVLSFQKRTVMTKCLKTSKAKELAELLLTDIAYHDSVKDYLVMDFESDPVATKYWMMLLGIKDDIKDGDKAPEIVERLFDDFDGFKSVIKLKLAHYLIGNKHQLLYWLMWFAGFESNDLEICEDALIKGGA